ncbi:uncharacterized protein LOC128209637 isoform X2 [Mya arenaria]|uniref:uncharacterized protein LOC128209637 isoform X2 n=1 Tax=Mya arenaria TaxID=6604 RepID=UPI0022E870A0|nr:uncharacterized protein LOC128209637 isoform X2 [Mya arenaria]
MDSLLFLLKLCFLLVVAVYAQDNIVEIEFRRISDSRPDKPQIVTELLVDYISNDTFEIMCKLNDVNHLNTLAFLILWQSDGSLKIKLQNDNQTVTKTYRKPTFYSNVTRWTAAGLFDIVTSNSRNTTLGVSRSVSSFTCTDTRMYKCYVQYINYAMKQDFGIIDKQLKVQVTPSKITKQIFDASGDGETIISDLTNSTTIVHVGQKLRLQCTANIGSFNSSVNIVWMRSSLDNESQLVPFTSGKQIVGEPKAFGSCEFEQNDSVLYNVSQDDALTSGNRFYVQCYVHITSTDWKTPEQHRPNFSFVVHMNDGNETEAVDFKVISAIIGGVCALVILGVAGIFLKRKFSNPRLSKADEKSEETSRRPDETDTSFPLARLYETPAEIDEPSNLNPPSRQRNRYNTKS